MGVHSLVREYLSGSIASSLTYSMFSPLEVVKTRLQLQNVPGFARSETRFLHTLIEGMRQDGLLLFWSHGLVAGVSRDFAYSGFRTGMCEHAPLLKQLE